MTMMPACRVVLLSALGWAVSWGSVRAQAPSAPPHSSPGVVEVTGAESSRDPRQAATERADAAVRELEGPPEAISDPTVFVKGAVLGALTEIELAKMAQSKSQDVSVRNFAGRVLKDSESVRVELTGIAQREHLGVPTSLVYEDEQTLKQGAAKSGREFVAWYTRQMLVEDDRARALFEGAAKLQDRELAGFARKKLPEFEERQQMAAALMRGQQ